MSVGAYSPDKAAAHPDRLAELRAGGHPHPVHLHLVLSDLCNLDCPGCAYRMSGYSSNELFADGTRNPARFLPTALVERTLHDCAEMGTRGVEFTGGGEPTLHRDAERLIRLAQDLGLDTAVVTNGLRIRGGLRDALARCTWVRVSVDAATEGVYATVRPSVGGSRGNDLRSVLESLSSLRSAVDSGKTGCTIGAGFVVQRENWHEVYDAVKAYRDRGAHNVRISGLFTPEGVVYHRGHFEAAAELERRAVADFDSPEFRVHARFAEKVADLDNGPPSYPTCHYQRFTTYLGGDGKLYRCCVQSYSRLGLLADLRDHGGSLKAAWESDQVRAKLDGFDARSCERCQFNDRNRAAAKLIEHPSPPSVGVVHPNFV